MRGIVWPLPGQRRGGRDPACIASHGLDDLDRVARVDRLGIEAGVPHRKGEPSCDAAITRTVVGDREIIVHRFRQSHDGEFVALLTGHPENPVGGIHRIVSARDKEVADVVRGENLQDPVIVLLIELVPARTE